MFSCLSARLGADLSEDARRAGNYMSHAAQEWKHKAAQYTTDSHSEMAKHKMEEKRHQIEKENA